MMRIAIIYVDPELTPIEVKWSPRSHCEAHEGGGKDFQDSSISSAISDIESIATCLEAFGHEVFLQPAIDPAGLCSFVEQRKPDLILNTCDSFGGHSALEMNLAALFELLGVSCIGAPALSLGVAQNKALAKTVLSSHGIPTPWHMLVEPGYDPSGLCGLPFPLIVKPLAEDGSVGIDDRAVVQDVTALTARVRLIWREFAQPALVEQFIDGREFHVSLLGTSHDELTILPIVEIDFQSLSPERPRILGYEAKWDNGAIFSQARAMRCPTTLDVKTEKQIGKLSIAAARCIGARDYVRIDLRLRESDDSLFVLEVNPNPDLSSDCAFARAIRASGRTYSEAMNALVKCAGERRLRSTLGSSALGDRHVPRSVLAG